MAFGSFERKSSSQPMAEINMVPLIDVVLVLLVIFIVTAPLLTNVVKLDLPRATANAELQKPEKIEFAIDAQGGLFWNGERLTREDAIARVWVVEKPTTDGVVTSVEAFDGAGEVMAMFFGVRKPGLPELETWRALVRELPRRDPAAALA